MQHKDSAVETFGVVLALVGLTFLMAGTVSFAVAGTWLNSFSVMFTPVGAIMLAGSAIIMWRLAAVLMLPAGIVGVSIGLIGVSGLPENAPRLPYVMPVIIGGVFIVASAGLNLPALLRRKSKRKGLIGANAAVMCIAGLALLIAVNYIGTLWYSRRDLTASGIHTLSSKTLEILKNLDEPVTVTAILPSDPEVAVEQVQQQVSSPARREMFEKVFRSLHTYYKDLLLDYARYSKNGNLKVQFIDPFNEPDKLRTFFAETKEGQSSLSVVFQSQKAFRQIPWHQLVNLAATQQDRLVFTGESRLTPALLQVTDKRSPTIYFTTGKGEPPIEPAESPNEPSMSQIAHHIRQDNYTLKTINLAAAGAVPGDCDILAIIGPKQLFRVKEIESIKSYLDGGGRLFVALEPEAFGGRRSNLNTLLESYGIRPRSDVLAVADSEQLLKHYGKLGSFLVFASHPRHELTQQMQQVQTLFAVTGMLELVEPPAGSDGKPAMPAPYDARPVALSPQEAWGDTEPLEGDRPKFDPDKDIKGPLILAIASRRQNPDGESDDAKSNTARVVAAASLEMFFDNIALINPANIDFTLNSINWLAERTERLGIADKTLLDPIRISRQETDAIFYSTLFGLPYIVLLIGGIVYWRRSR